MIGVIRLGVVVIRIAVISRVEVNYWSVANALTPPGPVCSGNFEAIRVSEQFLGIGVPCGNDSAMVVDSYGGKGGVGT